MGRSHPARQARVVVGAAGSAGFLVMVGTISQASTQILAADLSAALEVPATPPGLDLEGTAVPGPAVVADDAEAMSESDEAPPSSVASEEAPTSSVASGEAGTETSVADDAAPETEEQPATTVATTPPTTTTTTAPPRTDTTSSGS